MRATHTEVGSLGWIGFDRHLFFFRDARLDRNLMADIDDRYRQLADIQHMVVNPRDWPQLWRTIKLVGERGWSLCSLVIVVAPRLELPP